MMRSGRRAIEAVERLQKSENEFTKTLLDIVRPDKNPWVEGFSAQDFEDKKSEFGVQINMNDLPNPYDAYPLWAQKIYRGDFLLHTSVYRFATVEEARRDARHYFAWDRVTKVELIHPNGKIEEINRK